MRNGRDRSLAIERKRENSSRETRRGFSSRINVTKVPRLGRARAEIRPTTARIDEAPSDTEDPSCRTLLLGLPNPKKDYREAGDCRSRDIGTRKTVARCSPWLRRALRRQHFTANSSIPFVARLSGRE